MQPRAKQKDRAEPADKKNDGDEQATKEDLDAQLDEQLEDSFPASDPPSLTQDPQ